MTYISGLGRFAVDGVTLPYQRIRVAGGQRDHVHEFPYVPGGLPEKFGRKLYEIDVDLKIDEGIMRAGGFYQGRNLFTNINVLMGRFEDGKRFPIYLPNIGEIQAYATDWSRDLDVRVQSGEALNWKFREDQDAASLIAKTLSIKPTATLASNLGALEAKLPVPPPDIFAQIRDAVNSLLAFRDTASMWTDFIVTKIAGLLALFEEADRDNILSDPLQFELLEALHALWASVQELEDSAGELAYYVTPRDTDAAGASMAIFHDTAHATDIMQLNALDDPYRIPAGTSLRYLKAA